MDRTYLEIIFLCGLVLQVILHVHYIQNYISGKHIDYFNKKERLYLLFILTGFQLLPLLYIFSAWFSFFDYTLPKWLGYPATLLYCFGVWLFFRAYSDLGPYWSPGLEIKNGHKLITTGVFKIVRHPMYAAFSAIAIAQVLMLQNWIVGPAFLLLSVPFYRHHVKREEQQLIRHFGDEYLLYKVKTNALVPKPDQIYAFLTLMRTKFLQNRRKNRPKA
jgi:protein-S-isoprenylcysteine O-methyltransferase Ste14